MKSTKIFYAKAIFVFATFISNSSFGASFYTSDISAQMTVSTELIQGPGGGTGRISNTYYSIASITPAIENQQGNATVTSSVTPARLSNGFSINIASSGDAMPVMLPGSLAEATFDSSMNYIDILVTTTDETTGGTVFPITRATFNYEILYSVGFGVDNPLNETSNASVNYLVTTGIGVNEMVVASGLINTISTGSITDQFSVDIISSGSEQARLYIGSLGQATSVVPIPGAVWLFGSSLLGSTGIARRKSKV